MVESHHLAFGHFVFWSSLLVLTELGTLAEIMNFAVS